MSFAPACPPELLANRPDVIAAEYALVNAFELTNVARADFYPALNLSATAGLQSLTLGNFSTLPPFLPPWLVA